ncbi:MAG: deoxyribonuclease V [Parcubacteria group bacterium Gr01-1014_38]|nr:MAG: deoxyribonuclease V [Parcubacteria group bacterium Gr01-1014_38]
MLHGWDITPEETVRLQERLSTSVVQGPPLDAENVQLVAGVDVSSEKEHPLLTAGIVVCRAHDPTEIVETTAAQQSTSFPYIPGLLAFRELPAVVGALQQLQSEPDAFLVDGHGWAHPRRFGIACHLGLLLDRPTVGVAKSLLVGIEANPGPNMGDFVPLRDRGEEIGRIVRTKERTQSLYISVGHKIDLPSAVALVLRLTHGYRLPEPSRLAHLHVNAVRKTGHGGLVTPATPHVAQQRLW